MMTWARSAFLLLLLALAPCQSLAEWSSPGGDSGVPPHLLGRTNQYSGPNAVPAPAAPLPVSNGTVSVPPVGGVYSVLLTGNVTLGCPPLPRGAILGQSYTIKLYQDAVGSRTVAPSASCYVLPTASFTGNLLNTATAPRSEDVLACQTAPKMGGGWEFDCGFIQNLVPPAAWALVAHTSSGSTNSTSITTSAINDVGANLLVVHVASGVLSPTYTLSDSSSNSWGSTPALHINSANGAIDTWFLVAPTVTSSQTFTVTGSGNTYPSIVVESFSGPSSPVITLDRSSSGATSGGLQSSVQTGSITPTANNELIVTSVSLSNSQGSTPTVDSGITQLDYMNNNSTNEGVAAGYLIQPAAAAINPTWTWPTLDDSAANILSFKP